MIRYSDDREPESWAEVIASRYDDELCQASVESLQGEIEEAIQSELFLQRETIDTALRQRILNIKRKLTPHSVSQEILSEIDSLAAIISQEG